MSIISLLDKILGILPIQKRKERWKNQLDQLDKERKELLKGDCNGKKAERLIYINTHIDELHRLLKNASEG